MNIAAGDGRWRYIGEADEMEYVPGRVYQLSFYCNGGWLIAASPDGGKPCPYSVSGFIQNWELVK